MFIVLAVRLSPAAPEHRLSPAACLPPAVTTTLLQVWCHVNRPCSRLPCALPATWWGASRSAALGSTATLPLLHKLVRTQLAATRTVHSSIKTGLLLPTTMMDLRQPSQSSRTWTSWAVPTTSRTCCQAGSLLQVGCPPKQFLQQRYQIPRQPVQGAHHCLHLQVLSLAFSHVAPVGNAKEARKRNLDHAGNGAQPFHCLLLAVQLLTALQLLRSACRFALVTARSRNSWMLVWRSASLGQGGRNTRGGKRHRGPPPPTSGSSAVPAVGCASTCGKANAAATSGTLISRRRTLSTAAICARPSQRCLAVHLKVS
jgi:hypothetical protein